MGVGYMVYMELDKSLVICCEFGRGYDANAWKQDQKSIDLALETNKKKKQKTKNKTKKKSKKKRKRRQTDKKNRQ